MDHWCFRQVGHFTTYLFATRYQEVQHAIISWTWIIQFSISVVTPSSCVYYPKAQAFVKYRDAAESRQQVLLGNYLSINDWHLTSCFSCESTWTMMTSRVRNLSTRPGTFTFRNFYALLSYSLMPLNDLTCISVGTKRPMDFSIWIWLFGRDLCRWLG